MNISTWNTRSMGTRSGQIEPAKRKYIRTMTSNQDLVIFTETRHIKREAWSIKWTKGMRTILNTPARGTRQTIQEAIDTGREELPHLSMDNLAWQEDQPQANEGGRGGGGIIVTANKNIKVLSSRGICQGHAIVAYLSQNKQKNFFLTAIYAPTGIEHQRTFWRTLEEDLERFIAINNPITEAPKIHIIGDFNLDPGHIEDQQTKQIVNRLLQNLILKDIGQTVGNSEPSWRGDGDRGSQKSRIDILLSTEHELGDHTWSMQQEKSPSDHDWMKFELDAIRRPYVHPRVKDYILLKDQFLVQAQDCITKILVEHSEEFIRNRQSQYEVLLAQNANPSVAELNLEMADSSSPAAILNLVIHKTKEIYNKIAKVERNKNKEEIRKHTQKMLTMTRKLDAAATEEERKELRDEICLEKSNWINHNRNTEIKNRERIEAFLRKENGKMTATTFSHTKEDRFRARINKIIENEQEYTNEEDILEKFREHLAQSIANVGNRTHVDIKNVMTDLQIEHPAFHPTEEEKEEASRQITLEEIKEALGSMQSESTPGLTGTTRSFFLWMITIIPRTFTEGYNDFIAHHTNNPAFQWVKKRKIVFIPKKGKPKERVESYRPISLLEVFYKIGAKILIKRIGNIVNDRISKTQFGFIPTRTAAEASTYLQTLIRRAHRTREPMQIVFLDAKSAFDLTNNQTTTEMMKHLGVPETLIKNIDNLTNKGFFQVEMFHKSSSETEITSGTGQGCPASALKFDIIHEANLKLLKNKKFTWALKIEGQQVDPAAFADDCSIPTQFRTVEDYKEMIVFFDSLAEITGFTINQSKTEILAFNTDDNLIEEINRLNKGKIVTKVRHLGIILTSEENQIEQANYEYIQSKLKDSMKRVTTRNHSTYTRALLTQSILHSQANHILMATKLNRNQLADTQKIIYETLWKKKNHEDAMIEGRHKIAKARTHAPIMAGGLNMRNTQIKAECLYADSGVRHLRRYLDGEAPAMIETYLHELIPEDITTMGSRHFKTLSTKRTDLAPIYVDTLGKMADIIKRCEEGKETWEASAIRGSIYDNPFPITTEENKELRRKNLTTISQLFNNTEPRSLDKLEDHQLPRNLQIKIQNIAKNIKNRRQEFKNAPLRRNHAESILIDKTINLSHLIKKEDKRNQEGKWITAPSRQTRIRDGIPVPNMDIYNQAYKINYESRFSEYQKALNLSILNRTIWTNSKAFKSNMSEDEKCRKCGETETVEHIFLNCEEYTEKLWEELKELLQICKTKPGVVTLTQEHIIYLKEITLLTKTQNEETREIMQEIKQLIYGSRHNERQTYEPVRRNAHIRKCIIQIIRHRTCNARNTEFSEKLLEQNNRRATQL